MEAADDYERLFTAREVERWLRPEPMRPFRRSELVSIAKRDRDHWDRYGYGPWAVRDREEGGFVGRGGLARAMVDGQWEVELPWAVIPSCQGRGYATEMAKAAIKTARTVGLERVVSLALPHNLASRRVMEKAGLNQVSEIEHAGLPHVLYELWL